MGSGRGQAGRVGVKEMKKTALKKSLAWFICVCVVFLVEESLRVALPMHGTYCWNRLRDASCGRCAFAGDPVQKMR